MGSCCGKPQQQEAPGQNANSDSDGAAHAMGGGGNGRGENKGGGDPHVFKVGGDPSKARGRVNRDPAGGKSQTFPNDGDAAPGRERDPAEDRIAREARRARKREALKDKEGLSPGQARALAFLENINYSDDDGSSYSNWGDPVRSKYSEDVEPGASNAEASKKREPHATSAHKGGRRGA